MRSLLVTRLVCLQHLKMIVNEELIFPQVVCGLLANFALSGLLVLSYTSHLTGITAKFLLDDLSWVLESDKRQLLLLLILPKPPLEVFVVCVSASSQGLSTLELCWDTSPIGELRSTSPTTPRSNGSMPPFSTSYLLESS